MIADRKAALVRRSRRRHNDAVTGTPPTDTLEVSAPRPSPPPPLPSSIGAVLALFDRGLLDARTARAALAAVHRGRTMPEVLEQCGVPHSLREKADLALRPKATRLDDATRVALALVPPAVATLAGELARFGGVSVGVLLGLGGAVGLAALPPRLARSASAAATVAALFAVAQERVAPGVLTFAIVAAVVASAAGFAARLVDARARSAVTGLLAAGAIEALRVVLAQPPSG